jgi:cell wall-active antibiotic response 4TMS protein YvqF
LRVIVNMRGHDVFWPLVLVGAGVVLLLQNLGLIAAKSIDRFLNLWPLLLVLLGIGLVLHRSGVSSRTATIAGQALSAAIVVGAVLYAIFGLPASS